MSIATQTPRRFQPRIGGLTPFERLATDAAKQLAPDPATPLTLARVAEATKISERALCAIRTRLRPRGLWPWPNATPVIEATHEPGPISEVERLTLCAASEVADRGGWYYRDDLHEAARGLGQPPSTCDANIAALRRRGQWPYRCRFRRATPSGKGLTDEQAAEAMRVFQESIAAEVEASQVRAYRPPVEHEDLAEIWERRVRAERVREWKKEFEQIRRRA